MALKTNTECIAILNVVIARLEAGPQDARDWSVIETQIGEAKAYASKCMKLRLGLVKEPNSTERKGEWLSKVKP